jgi:hypothetical protein
MEIALRTQKDSASPSELDQTARHSWGSASLKAEGYPAQGSDSDREDFGHHPRKLNTDLIRSLVYKPLLVAVQRSYLTCAPCLNATISTTFFCSWIR